MNSHQRKKADALRKRAEALLDKSPVNADLGDLTDLKTLAHELAVYQTELELQNEELRQTYMSLEETKDLFVALYENAPVGYVVLDKVGLILRANNTFAHMINISSDRLKGIAFADHMPSEDARLFRTRFSSLMKNPVGKTLIARFKGDKGGLRFTQLEFKHIDFKLEKHAKILVTVSDITALRRAEETIRAQRNTLGYVLEGTHVGTWEWNVQTGETVFNERWAEILGYQLKDLSPISINTWVSLTHPDDIILSNKLLESHFSGEVTYYECEARMRHRNGNWIWVLDRGKVKSWTPDGKPLMMYGTHQDITERKQAEHALIKSEEKWRNILINTPQIGISLNPRSQIVFANAQFLKLTGWTKEEIIGQNWFDLFIPEDVRDEVRQVFDHVMSAGTIDEFTHYENEIVDRKGKRHLVSWFNVITKDSRGGIMDVTSLGVDLTEQKRAERALKESERKFRILFDTSPQAVALSDMKTGRIVDFNETLLQLTKYAKNELIGKTTTEMGFYAGEDRDRFIHELKRSGAVNGMRMDFKVKDGSTINTRMFAVPIQVEGKSLILTSFFDMTDINRLENQLQHARKLEAIATLAGGVAHEFNNALTSVLGYVELLKKDLTEVEDYHDYFKYMELSGQRMSRLTSQLLAYARGGKNQPKHIKLNEFVTQSLPIIQHVIKPSVKVETRLMEHKGFIEADQTQMQMVLSTLLANSDEAMEKNGHIQISLKEKNADEMNLKDQPVIKAGRYVCLKVEDDGKGMGEEEKARIFDPFFTTKFHGRGMGMAAVYGIVKNHGGWISVDSQPGKGTTVRIYLPIAEMEETIEESNPIEPLTGSGTILVIEDEEMILETTREMLKRLGYQVIVAENGKAAVRVAETFDGDIDLALLDIIMPDMDGGKVYSRLIKVRPRLKVIVFSGYSIDGPAKAILDAGAQDFIQKPFTLNHLAKKVKEVLEDK